MTGKIENDTGLINQETGLINDNTGLIEEETGLITEDAGMITDNDSVEDAGNGRKKRSRERGKDSKPRNFPLHTLKNLPQFRDKSHEEMRQYILETKGIDIGNNTNVGKITLWVLVGLLVIAVVIGIWKWHKDKNTR